MIRKTNNPQLIKRKPSIRQHPRAGILQSQERIQRVAGGIKIVGADKNAGKRDGHVAQPDLAVSFCTVDDAAAAGGDCRVVVPGYYFGERDVLRGDYGEVGEGVSVDGC
jgi:hypothetical protein